MSMVKVVLKSEFDRMFADELRIFIFAFLDVQSLCRAAQVRVIVATQLLRSVSAKQLESRY